MSTTKAIEKVIVLITEYGFWEAAKSHILKTFNEIRYTDPRLG